MDFPMSVIIFGLLFFGYTLMFANTTNSIDSVTIASVIRKQTQNISSQFEIIGQNGFFPNVIILETTWTVLHPININISKYNEFN